MAAADMTALASDERFALLVRESRCWGCSRGRERRSTFIGQRRRASRATSSRRPSASTAICKAGSRSLRSRGVSGLPDNEYGWEKLYAERVALAFGRKYATEVRIARFQNCYGPEGTWTGGREKAPAAICRKVAEAADGGTIEVWGDGTAVRSYTYVDDMVDGIYRLTQSCLPGPVNIGSPEYVSVAQLVNTIAEVAGKTIRVKYVEGPGGVQSRNFSNERIYSIGWRARYSLTEGIARTYPWVHAQVEGGRAGLPAVVA